ncbi:hypothetical protein Tco_1072318 [Tanacetum coccineum]
MIDQGVTAALAARDANKNGDDNHTSGTGARRTERVARECTYQDFMKCQPLYFKGTEGVVELTQWSLTWWNSHVRIVGHDVAYTMTWTNLRKKMTNKYCPRNEMKKLEAELIFPEESDKVERYVGCLPDMIHGNVVASKPKTIQEATEMATELMDKKISTFAERQAENKRKLDNNRQGQQQLPKRKNVARAYATGIGKRKEYVGTLPLEVCYGKLGKLNPRYVGLSKVMEEVGSIAYKLELPQELSRVHHTFHVSNLKKCYTDEPLAVPFNGFHIEDKLHFIEEPSEIMDRKVKLLKQSRILILKVRWNSGRGPEFN